MVLVFQKKIDDNKQAKARVIFKKLSKNNNFLIIILPIFVFFKHIFFQFGTKMDVPMDCSYDICSIPKRP